MEPDAGYLGTFFKVARAYAPALLAALLALIVFVLSQARGVVGAGTAPSILDPIPFVFNTVQFVFNNDKFMKRTKYVVTPNHATATLLI
jgi:hypothetical protein